MANIFQKLSKDQDRRGRCLHYDKGERCNEIISSHSIQNKGQLSLIAEGSHVYCLSGDLSILKKTGGKPMLKKTGIKKASTFDGFCQLHDNKLFEPIDNFPLRYDKKQIALYAYRCICRELFVKENAVSVLEKVVVHPTLDPDWKPMVHGSLIGNKRGLSSLRYHKNAYDYALLNEKYEDFEFICFDSSSQCNAQFSGLLYPDYDFDGNFLQNVGIGFLPLDLITFFTAPVEGGWAFGFAWHVSSEKACMSLIDSLANKIRNGERLEDVIFRFALTCCENHAIRISWWDQLGDNAKNASLERMHLMASPTEPVPPDYLVSGCEGIADWDFNHVHPSWQSA